MRRHLGPRREQRRKHEGRNRPTGSPEIRHFSLGHSQETCFPVNPNPCERQPGRRAEEAGGGAGDDDRATDKPTRGRRGRTASAASTGHQGGSRLRLRPSLSCSVSLVDSCRACTSTLIALRCTARPRVLKEIRRVSGDRLPSLGSNQDSPDPEGPFTRVRVTRCWSLLALGVGLCRSLLAHMSGFVAVWQPELGPLMVGDLA
jgi:hypothetical protein